MASSSSNETSSKNSDTMTSSSKSRLSSARSKQSASSASINMGGVVSLPKIDVPDGRKPGGSKASVTPSHKSSLTLNTQSEPGLSYRNGGDLNGRGDQHKDDSSGGVIAGLTRDDLGDLEESFAVVDRSGDGTINSSKLYRVMTSLIGDNPTEAEVQDLIIANDADGGGTIEFDEYLQVMKDKVRVAPTDKELKIVYRMLDRNGSGGINLDDLTGVMRAMGAVLDDAEIKQMFEAVDLNGQKVISYEEFLDVVLSDDSEELNLKLEEMGLNKDYIRVVPIHRNYIDDLELD